MGEHDHNHEHAARQTKYGALDPEETRRLREEVHRNIGTSVGYFLSKAAECETQSERVFWLGKVDSARYFAEREAAKEKLDRTALRNLEAVKRLEGTEASLHLDRVVGNACIVKMEADPARPSPGGYYLVRRVSGETGKTAYGSPMGGQWVVQGLAMDRLHEFAVVSQDDQTAQEVTGPWLQVAIGSVSTEFLQEAERAEAERLYNEREALEKERQAAHAAGMAKLREERAEDLAQQQRDADVMNAKRERERVEREEAHAKAVKELPQCAPVDLKFQLRDQKGSHILCDITFKRGQKACKLFQFQVNGTVLGYYPDGRHSGRKRAGHVYKRTVNLPRGQDSKIRVYAVTDHGDAGDTVTLPVPQSLCDPEPAREPAPANRMDRIIAAVRSFTGRKTRSGKPWLRPLRRHADMDDITGRERDNAHRASQGD